MNEILCSLHNYTKFSGYSYSFYDMAQSAIDCGIDAVITTDRNIYPSGHDQYYFRDGKRLLVICGEELFDPVSEEAPRYLSIGINREQFNRRTGNPQDEIRILMQNIPNESDNFPYRHIELINAENLLNQGIGAWPKEIRKSIQNFDDLLLSDQNFLGFTGTCSENHTEKYNYKELFSTVCNHILSEEELNGDFVHDKLLILKCLKAGNLYMALDGLADANGFRFSAEGNNQDSITWPGDIIYLRNSITMKINIPEACTCRLIRNGKIIREWQQCKQVPYTIYEPGFYRVECALTIRRNLYDWIFSNPIFVVKG